jgi:hypothetical protein
MVTLFCKLICADILLGLQAGGLPGRCLKAPSVQAQPAVDYVWHMYTPICADSCALLVADLAGSNVFCIVSISTDCRGSATCTTAIQ